MGPLVVLAYSGGLDTSAIVPWLHEQYGARVLCFAADVGQGPGELDGLVEKAKRSGAVDCVVADLREEFVRDFVFPTLRAGAVYARTYLLGTAVARPVPAAHQGAAAQRAGAQAVAHGCTGKGNDQVRFELTYAALAPELQVIAPWREWQFQGREDLIAYVKAKGIPVQATLDKPYSTDRNLWHCSHEGGILEDPAKEPPEHIFVMTADPLEAPDLPALVEIGFEEGTPVAVNNVPLGPVELLESLNALAGEHGVGRADVVEDRLVGMKSRGVYETPGGTLLHAAHRELEQLVLDRRTLRLKDELALRYADLVYDGRWWTPEREALDALVAATQKNVTGAVRLKLFKGNVAVAGRESPYALYQPSYATFGKDNVYDQKDAAGFIHLYGLAIKIGAGLAATRRPSDVGAERLADGAAVGAPDEDVHTLVERLLYEEVGPVAGKLHTGRSRNDQVATDLRLWTLTAIDQLDSDLAALARTLVARAQEAVDVLLPGYTHGQRAQPVRWGYVLLAHAWPLERDRQRLADARRRVAELPLGSGALAGSGFAVDRVLKGSTRVSLDLCERPGRDRRPRLRRRSALRPRPRRHAPLAPRGGARALHQRGIRVRAAVGRLQYRVEPAAAETQPRRVRARPGQSRPPAGRRGGAGDDAQGHSRWVLEGPAGGQGPAVRRIRHACPRAPRRHRCDRRHDRGRGPHARRARRVAPRHGPGRPAGPSRCAVPRKPRPRGAAGARRRGT